MSESDEQEPAVSRRTNVDVKVGGGKSDDRPKTWADAFYVLFGYAGFALVVLAVGYSIGLARC